MRSTRAIALLGATMLASAGLYHAATAQVVGSLGNFDVVNDTGKTAHGFEIDLEGINVSDVTDTFGGVGRYFPPTVERYGAPSVSTLYDASSNPIGVKIVYQGNFSGSAWNVGTPSGVFSTPGESCWSGGTIGYGPATPCDHFGVGTKATPTKTTYKWLTETSPGSGTLAPVVANLPAPVLTVAAPPPGPPPPPHVVAVAPAPPAPAPGAFGTAEWVKVFTTQYDHPVALEDLMGGNGIVPQETEIEWQLLQAGLLDENLNQGDANAAAESVLYRYEFYQYSGGFSAEGEALTDVPTLDANGSPLAGGNVGNFIGAQNNALNLNGVFNGPPIGVAEPTSLALLAPGLLALWMRRRRC